MKTTILLPDPLFQSAEELAARLGMSRNQLYARAVETFVQTHLADDITEALDRVYATERSELAPVLAKMQSASLSTEDW